MAKTDVTTEELSMDELAEMMSVALITAIQDGNLEVAKMALEVGINPNSVIEAENDAGDILELPVLHLAVSTYNEDMVRLLVEHGADVNIRDGDGLTALEHLPPDEAGSMIRLLESFGAK